MAQVTKTQVAKSVIGALLGATPGAVWFFNAGTGQSAFIAVLGTFIGFALSLPGVSASRVLAGTGGMIVANNVPHSMQDKVLNTFLGEQPPPPERPAENEESHPPA